QKSPLHAIGGEAAISIQPAESSWDFSVALRYGRSNANRHNHQQHTVPPAYLPSTTVHLQGKNHNQTVAQTADYSVQARESHTIVDFDAGKDIGIGMRNSSIHAALGVRFAQFTESSDTKLLADPYPHFGYKYFPAYHLNVPFYRYYQSYKANAEVARSFQGLGPSLAFTGSVPMAGQDLERGQLAFDWGVNASVLFGRQKAHIHHQTTGRAYKGSFLGSGPPVSQYTNVTNPHRSRSVVVPNIGALAGLSFNFSNARISLGYRAD